MVFELPPLPYAYNALEPHIDEQTMRLHHDKHHAAYVKNLNAALEKHPELNQWSLEDLMTKIAKVPEDIRTMVRNHGGGHINHTMFWQIMAPRAGGEPTGSLASEIQKTFGHFAAFRDQLTKAAMGRFGSGWAWLVFDAGRLAIVSTANQDSPLMEGKLPVMGVDVWEHAYYLKYQNRRDEYLAAWWNVVNWAEVQKRYEMAQQGQRVPA
ncbi:MAG: superoxide dismutase [Chloroflexi bacterium]|nr:superoxide dismutase [Chloroflexota bacterium]